MQCTPGDVSATRVSMGLRKFETSTLPMAGLMRSSATIECGIDMCSLGSSARNAHMSTTWPPCVLTMLID
jgi:hypothetical protein